jgi:hypothetical protein
VVAQGLIGPKQAAIVEPKFPGAEGAVGNGIQEMPQTQLLQGIEAAGHQPFAAKLALQVSAGLDQGDGDATLG